MATNPDIIYVGQSLARLVESPENDIEFDGVGIVSASLHYMCRWDVAVELVSTLYRHPTFTWLIRSSAGVTRQEGNMAKVKVTFKGVPSDYNDDEDNPETKTYTLEGASVKEAIETHPKFKDMAGDSVATANKANGAVWASEGEGEAKHDVFKKFAPVKTPEGTLTPAQQNSVDHPKAGVKNYHAPSLIYTETRVYSRLSQEDILVDMVKIGKIDDPPKSDVLPTIGGKRNWLLLSANVVEVGVGVQVSKKWKMSGINGWDTDIYS